MFGYNKKKGRKEDRMYIDGMLECSQWYHKYNIFCYFFWFNFEKSIKKEQAKNKNQFPPKRKFIAQHKNWKGEERKKPGVVKYLFHFKEGNKKT